MQLVVGGSASQGTKSRAGTFCGDDEFCMDGAIYKSEDGAGYWHTALALHDGMFTGLAVHPATPSIVVAAHYFFGIHVSGNSGAFWNQFNEGLGTDFVRSLAISHTAPYTTYAGTEDFGVYKFNE